MSATSETPTTASSPSNDDLLSNLSLTGWRVYVAIALLLASILFRVPGVRFIFAIAGRIAGNETLWLVDCKKQLGPPLKWLITIFFLHMCLLTLTWDDQPVIAFFYSAVAAGCLIWTVNAAIQVIRTEIERNRAWKALRSAKMVSFSQMLLYREGLGVLNFFLDIIIFTWLVASKIAERSFTALVICLFAFFFWIAIGAYTFIKNCWGGLFLLSFHFFDYNPWICLQGELAGIEGHCQSVDLRFTKVVTSDRAVVHIPNGLLLENAVKVHKSRPRSLLRLYIHLDMSVEVSKIRHLVRQLDTLVVNQLKKSNTRRAVERVVQNISNYPKSRGEDTERATVDLLGQSEMPKFFQPNAQNSTVYNLLRTKKLTPSDTDSVDADETWAKQIVESVFRQGVDGSVGLTTSMPEEETSFTILESPYTILLQCSVVAGDEHVLIQLRSDLILAITDILAHQNIPIRSSIRANLNPLS